MQILARGSELVIPSWLVIHVTLEQEAAFALASVPVLTLVIDCRALNLLTSDPGSHGRSSVGCALCWCPYCVGASMLRCSVFGHIHVPICLVWVAFFFCFLGKFSYTVTICPLLCCCPPVLILNSWVLVVAVADCVESQ